MQSKRTMATLKKPAFQANLTLKLATDNVAVTPCQAELLRNRKCNSSGPGKLYIPRLTRGCRFHLVTCSGCYRSSRRKRSAIACGNAPWRRFPDPSALKATAEYAGH